MPRRPRLVLPGVPLHIMQRGNNRQVCFRAVQDYRCYLKWLGEYARESECRVHAYVLMTNHVHMLVTSNRTYGPAALMKALGQRYVRYFNRRYERSGTLWDGRYRSCLVQEEDYLLACYRYIELNPVRAGMVQHPAQYPWSSFRANALALSNGIVTPHKLYLALGQDSQQRRAAYGGLFSERLTPEQEDAFRQALNGNYALGDASFIGSVEGRLGRPATPRPPGPRSSTG